MKTASSCFVFAIVIGTVGCNMQSSDIASVKPTRALPLAGTNAGSNKQLTAEVSGWTFDLMAGQDRIAAYQFNEGGSVVATVGTEGKLDYPAMFWRVDENDQIVVSDERDFRVAAELWTILSIDGSVVTVKNATNNREETYLRKRRSSPPPSLLNDKQRDPAQSGGS